MEPDNQAHIFSTKDPVARTEPGEIGAKPAPGHCAADRLCAVSGDFEFLAPTTIPSKVPNELELLSSAETLANRGCLQEARTLYRQILGTNPTSTKALVALGGIERRLGDDGAACGYLRAAVSVDTNDLGALQDLAAVLRDLDRPEEAEALYQKILAADVNHVQSHMGLGWIARATDKEEAALAHFTIAEERLRAAAETNSNKPPILAQLATTLRELGRNEEAASIFRKILVTNPKHVPSLMGLGWIARRSGNHEGALAYFKAASELNSLDLHPQIALAKVLSLMHRFEEAETLYEKVLQRAPNHCQVHSALGTLAGIKRNWAGALEHFTAALNSDPENIQLRMKLGHTLCELSMWEDADRIYRGILDESPRSIEAMIGRAETANARGDTQAALELFEAAAVAAPLDLRPRREIRRLKMADGNYDWKTEVEEALAVVRSKDASCQMQIEASEILVKYGITEAPRPALSKLEARFPAARQLLLAIRQIERLGLAQPFSEASCYSEPVPFQLESLQGFLEVPTPNSDTLLLVFAGTNNRVSITFSLLHRILRKTGVSIIYCRDLPQELYARGVVGLGNDFQSTVQSFNARASKYGAKRILAMGHCLGCLGALRFGLALGSPGVLGLGPKLNPGNNLKPSERTHLSRVRSQLTVDHRSIRKQYLESKTRPKVSLIFGEHYTVDTSDLESMSDLPGVTITGTPESADPVKDLLVRGILEPLLKDFVTNGVLSPAIRELISTTRSPN